MECYLTGLLIEHPNKNCDSLVQVLPGTSEQSLQGLLTTMRWDEQALTVQPVAHLRRLASEGDAILTVDDMGLPKQGNPSVGVARLVWMEGILAALDGTSRWTAIGADGPPGQAGFDALTSGCGHPTQPRRPLRCAPGSMRPTRARWPRYAAS